MRRLLYLYYAFDNRPWWYRPLWRISDRVRRLISILPHRLRVLLSSLIALVLYWPLARVAFVLDRFGVRVEGLPLAVYRDRSLYTMRTDALDRFGTRFERRFTRMAMLNLMREAALNRSYCPTPPRSGAPLAAVANLLRARSKGAARSPL